MGRNAEKPGCMGEDNMGTLYKTWGFLMAMCRKMLNFAGKIFITNGIS